MKSIEELKEAKEKIKSIIISNGNPDWFSGVGIGGTKDNPGITVLVSKIDDSICKLIPSAINGINIELKVVGKIVPQNVSIEKTIEELCKNIKDESWFMGCGSVDNNLEQQLVLYVSKISDINVNINKEVNGYKIIIKEIGSRWEAL